jgi:hypothetical protein
VLEKHTTLLGFNYIHPFSMSMAQSAASEPQFPAIEQPCGQYKIHEQGNSLTVTVPRRIHVDFGAVYMREGKHHGRTIYLKAVPATPPQSAGSREITTDAGVTIVEDYIDLYDIRTKGDDTTLTVPSDCETDRLPEKSHPMVVAGYDADGVVYLKIIPECVYERAESIAPDALVRDETPVVV